MLKNDSNKAIDEIINSVDGISRATPGPYFFTRLQARLNKEKDSVWAKVGLWVSRPAIALSVLMIVILLNLAVIFNYTSSSDKADENGDYYTMASSNFPEYENP